MATYCREGGEHDEEVARLSRMTAGERHGKPVIMSLCKDFADVAQWVFENPPTNGKQRPAPLRGCAAGGADYRA